MIEIGGNYGGGLAVDVGCAVFALDRILDI